MSESGLEALPDVWEWSRRYSECPGVVSRTSRKCGSGQKAFTVVRESSGDHPGCPGVVARPSLMSRSDWETLPDVPEPLPNVR